MKKLIYALLFVPLFCFAQLPDGSTAPDFTITDIDGVQHNLYDILNQDKPVLLSLYSVSSGPDWSFYDTGVLNEFDALYGSSGANSVFTVAVESDPFTPLSAMQGGEGSVGDWTQLISHTLANDDNIAEAYALAYYPTIYLICPDRSVTEIGQGPANDNGTIDYWTLETLTEEVFVNICPNPTEGLDAKMSSYNGETVSCGAGIISPIVTLMNYGTQDLNACTIQTIVDGAVISSYDWTGSLSTFETSEVELAELPAYTTDVSFNIVVVGDLNLANNNIDISIIASTQAHAFIHVTVNAGFYPVETSWQITDASGSIVASASYEGGNADSWNGGGPDADMTHDHFINSLVEGCYTFTAMDSWGDGQTGYAGAGAGTDGSIIVTDGNGTELLSISGNWGSEAVANFEVINGCMDSNACNFSLNATVEGDCEYYTVSSQVFNFGIPVFNADGTPVIETITYPEIDCNENPVLGCMDSNACNFSSNATIEVDCEYYTVSSQVFNSGIPVFNADGTPVIETITYPEIDCNQSGCTDVNALNYDSDANIDDGSCEYSIFCLEIDENQIVDLFNGYTNAYVEDNELLEYMNQNYMFSQGTDLFSQGTQVFLQGSNIFTQGSNILFTGGMNLLDEIIEELYSIFNFYDTSCIDVTFGCTDPYAVNYNPYAIGEYGLCEYSDINNDELMEAYNTIDNLQNEIFNLQSQLDDMLSNNSNCEIMEEEIPVYLPQGWGMFGYTCLEPMNVEDAFSEVVSSIQIVKDNDGNPFLPEFGFNGLGDLVYSRGYQIKTFEEILDFSFCPTITGMSDEMALPQRQVGDYAEGGIVFWVDETGEHGLVAALEDLTEGSYDPFGLGVNGYEWGCYNEYVDGADGTDIGTGYQNTIDIINQGCGTEYGGITAAQAALDAEIEGYSDWYLPSQEELLEMYNTIGNGGSEGNIEDFENNYYWSSSEYNEYNSNYAWYVRFSDGGSVHSIKHNSYRVRVIRAF